MGKINIAVILIVSTIFFSLLYLKEMQWSQQECLRSPARVSDWESSLSVPGRDCHILQAASEQFLNAAVLTPRCLHLIEIFRLLLYFLSNEVSCFKRIIIPIEIALPLDSTNGKHSLISTHVLIGMQQAKVHQSAVSWDFLAVVQ